MDSLSTWLFKQQTFPIITQLFIARITLWRNHQEVTFPEPDLDFIVTAYREQTNIGWYNFLQGHISNYWVKIQLADYKKLESRRTLHTWAQNLIHHLWDISWNMWKNCDDILHNVHTKSDNRLSQKLDQHLRKEFSIDIRSLAPIHHYMLVRRTSLALLLLWKNAKKAAWLATIKITHIIWKRKI
jgi:hypothetical protein